MKQIQALASKRPDLNLASDLQNFKVNLALHFCFHISVMESMISLEVILTRQSS